MPTSATSNPLTASRSPPLPPEASMRAPPSACALPPACLSAPAPPAPRAIAAQGSVVVLPPHSATKSPLSRLDGPGALWAAVRAGAGDEGLE
jgi:hypothetical protein